MALRDEDAKMDVKNRSNGNQQQQPQGSDYSSWVRYFVFGAQWLIFILIVVSFGMAVIPFQRAKNEVSTFGR